MYPAGAFDAGQRQYADELPRCQVQVETGRHDERGSVFALFAATDRIKVDKPDLTGSDGRWVPHSVHSSAIGASASDHSSASAM